MDHQERKITKIAREAERLLSLTMRGEGVGTAEIDCIHAVRHNPGITQTELAAKLNADKPAIARRVANLERKGYIRRSYNESRSIEVLPPRGTSPAWSRSATAAIARATAPLGSSVPATSAKRGSRPSSTTASSPDASHDPLVRRIFVAR